MHYALLFIHRLFLSKQIKKTSAMDEKKSCCKSQSCHYFMLVVGIVMTISGGILLGVDLAENVVKTIMDKVQ